MWLTGFDAPSCSTVYLDKPMRNHTLMQTIARANRVFPGKNNGLIVDYANIFASLEKALAIYGKGENGVTPLRDKAVLVDELRKALRFALLFCDGHGVSIGKIEQAGGGSLERLNLLAEAVNVLISPDPVRKEFLGYERLVATLYKAIMPDLAVIEFSSPVSCLFMLAGVIREQLGEGPADISGVMGKIAALLDQSIAADGFRIRESPPGTSGGSRVIDLSAIDFEVLVKRFAKSKQKNVDLERLKAAIQAQLDKMIRLNHTRAISAENLRS
jgi:type I restriction enzyme R subunit